MAKEFNKLWLELDVKVRNLVSELIEPSLHKLQQTEKFQVKLQKLSRNLTESMRNLDRKIDDVVNKIPNIEPLQKKLTDLAYKIENSTIKSKSQSDSLKIEIDACSSHLAVISTQLVSAFNQHEVLRREVNDCLSSVVQMKLFVEDKTSNIRREMHDPLVSQAETNISFQMQLKQFDKSLEVLGQELNSLEISGKHNERSAIKALTKLESQLTTAEKESSDAISALKKEVNRNKAENSKRSQDIILSLKQDYSRLEKLMKETQEKRLVEAFEFILIEPRYKKRLNEFKELKDVGISDGEIIEVEAVVEPQELKKRNMSDDIEEFKSIEKLGIVEIIPNELLIKDKDASFENEVVIKPEILKSLEIINEGEKSRIKIEENSDTKEMRDEVNVDMEEEIRKNVLDNNEDSIVNQESYQVVQLTEKILSPNPVNLESLKDIEAFSPPSPDKSIENHSAIREKLNNENLKHLETTLPASFSRSNKKSHPTHPPRAAPAQRKVPRLPPTFTTPPITHKDYDALIEDLQLQTEKNSHLLESLEISSNSQAGIIDLLLKRQESLSEAFKSSLATSIDSIEKSTENELKPWVEALISKSCQDVLKTCENFEVKKNTEIYRVIQNQKELEAVLKQSSYEFTSYITGKKRKNSDVKIELKRIYSKIEALNKKVSGNAISLDKTYVILKIIKDFLNTQQGLIKEESDKSGENKKRNAKLQIITTVANSPINKTSRNELGERLNSILEILNETLDPETSLTMRSATPELPNISKNRLI